MTSHDSRSIVHGPERRASLEQPGAPITPFQIEIVRTPAGPELIGKPVALVEPDLRAIVMAGVVREQHLGLLRFKGLIWRTGEAAADLLAELRQFGEPQLVPHPRQTGQRAILADVAVRMTPRSWQALALLTEGYDRLFRVLELRPGDPPSKLLFQRSGDRWGAVVVDPADWPNLLADLIAEGRQRLSKS